MSIGGMDVASRSTCCATMVQHLILVARSAAVAHGASLNDGGVQLPQTTGLLAGPARAAPPPPHSRAFVNLCQWGWGSEGWKRLGGWLTS